MLKENLTFNDLPEVEIFFFQVSGVIMLQNRHTGIGAQGGRQPKKTCMSL